MVVEVVALNNQLIAPSVPLMAFREIRLVWGRQIPDAGKALVKLVMCVSDVPDPVLVFAAKDLSALRSSIAKYLGLVSAETELMGMIGRVLPSSVLVVGFETRCDMMQRPCPIVVQERLRLHAKQDYLLF
jgi:hypothetical protein